MVFRWNVCLVGRLDPVDGEGMMTHEKVHIKLDSGLCLRTWKCFVMSRLQRMFGSFICKCSSRNTNTLKVIHSWLKLPRSHVATSSTTCIPWTTFNTYGHVHVSYIAVYASKCKADAGTLEYPVLKTLWCHYSRLQVNITLPFAGSIGEE